MLSSKHTHERVFTPFFSAENCTFSRLFCTCRKSTLTVSTSFSFLSVVQTTLQVWACNEVVKVGFGPPEIVLCNFFWLTFLAARDAGCFDVCHDLAVFLVTFGVGKKCCQKIKFFWKNFFWQIISTKSNLNAILKLFSEIFPELEAKKKALCFLTFHCPASRSSLPGHFCAFLKPPAAEDEPRFTSFSFFVSRRGSHLVTKWPQGDGSNETFLFLLSWKWLMFQFSSPTTNQRPKDYERPWKKKKLQSLV